MILTRRSSLLGLTALAVTPLPLLAGRAAAQALSAEDYVLLTLQTGQFSLTTSQLALEKAQEARVRQFAELEIAEMNAVAAVLSPTGITPPTTLPADKLAIVESLAAAEGGEFDRTYLEAQLVGHDEALAVQQPMAQQSEITIPVATAKLAETAIASHIAMLRLIQEDIS